MARPKINLRDFFWLTALVAMGMGWRHDRNLQQQRMDANADFATRLIEDLRRECKDLKLEVVNYQKMLRSGSRTKGTE
jgi:hypothetical protein